MKNKTQIFPDLGTKSLAPPSDKNPKKYLFVMYSTIKSFTRTCTCLRVCASPTKRDERNFPCKEKKDRLTPLVRWTFSSYPPKNVSPRFFHPTLAPYPFTRPPLALSSPHPTSSSSSFFFPSSFSSSRGGEKGELLRPVSFPPLPVRNEPHVYAPRSGRK